MACLVATVHEHRSWILGREASIRWIFFVKEQTGTIVASISAVKFRL